jgi:dTDP-4-dehydrorhamnose reductase
MSAGGAYLIVRTSWLFGPHGRNFVETILERAERGEALRVVDDQIGRPTLAGDLADALWGLVDCGARGVYHFANAGACSWHAFAGRIVALAGLDASITPIKSAEWERPARRPAYSVLDTSDYERLTGRVPADWPDALERYMRARTAIAK